MTLHSAKTFLGRVNQNRGLQTQLERAGWDALATIRIADTLGFQFSNADLRAAIDSTWGVLSEEELIGVTGGGGSGRTGGGKVTTDTDTAGDASDSDTYTPPPGDVSGNSCFFSRSSRR